MALLQRLDPEEIRTMHRANEGAEEFEALFTSVRQLAAGAGELTTGTRALKPGGAALNDFYFETDTQWLYYWGGVAWLYLAGVYKATDAQRSALTISANDNGALLYATDTKLWWRVSSGSWAQMDVAGLVVVRKNSGANVGTRGRLNLIEGSNVTLTVADDAGGGEVDITIAASGGGGGSSTAAILSWMGL